MAPTKAELTEELESLTTKADLIEILDSHLLKADLVSLLEDESGATKEELVHKLEARRKDELLDAVSSHLNKEELEKVVDERRPDEEDDDEDDDEAEEDDEPSAQQDEDEQSDDEDEPVSRDDQSEDSDDRSGSRDTKPVRVIRDESTDIDWNAELDWAPPPRATPAPISFVGAPPFQPGQRVRVDISGLPMLGIFAGKGATAAGTIIGVNARERQVRVYLDAVMNGEKEIVLPPERVQPDV